MKPAVNQKFHITETAKLLLGAVIICWIFFNPSVSVAQPLPAFNEVRDHGAVARFPESQTISIDTLENNNYRLVVGSLQRVNGQVVPEKSERLRGRLTKITYEISPQYNHDEVLNFFLEQFEQSQYEQLFRCNGRSCGSSNYWANDVFSDRILYGPERNQFYMVMDASNASSYPTYVSIYIITRGNRRLYAHVEVIEQGLDAGQASEFLPTQMYATNNAPGETAVQELADTPSDNRNGQSLPRLNPDMLLNSLREKRVLRISNIEFDDLDQLVRPVELAMLAAALNRDRRLKVYVLAHLRTKGPGVGLGVEQEFEELMARSALRAEQVKRELVSLGVAASKMQVRSIGPLAPYCERGDCSERVELVLQ